MAWDNTDYYFSGQGVVLIGMRDADGNPAGLVPVGNVSDLKITVATSVIEHKESKTGARAIDLRMTTETKANLSMTVEHFDSNGLAIALRGSSTERPTASVVGEAHKLYFGKVTPLGALGVSAVAVRRGAQALTAFTNNATPYDYKVNAEGGSIMFNDGSVTPISTNGTVGGVVPTAVVVGATTSVTVANTAVAGSRVALSGFAGTDAAYLNGKTHLVLSATPTGVVLATNTLGRTITVGTPLAVFDGAVLAVDYTHISQFIVNPLVYGSQERWMRFEGLNTADNNNPVVVDIFRFLTDPLKEMALIGDTINNFALEGNVLADAGRPDGSKFFRQMMVR